MPHDIRQVCILIAAFFAVSVFPNRNDAASLGDGKGDGTAATIPYTLPWDDMPIDLSFVYQDEKPAGKHGFLKVAGDRFVFEDGTEARFWGTNFNSAQNFPSHQQSEKLARRLAKTGVNIVRFHQLDAEWSTPNIFQFTKGGFKPDTGSLDPESMDRLDYLIHCLKQEGIYVYMDLLTYRRFKHGDGVTAADRMIDGAKPYSTYDPKLIALQKRFNEALWNHVNPYTRLAYKDDPAIALVEVTNENDLFSKMAVLEPYRSDLEERYREWARERGLEPGKGKVDFTRKDERLYQFFIAITKEYYQETIHHMRELGVRIPIAGSNWSINAAHLSAQAVADFTDSHAYWYAWTWRGDDKAFLNESMTGSTNNMLPTLAFNRVSGKPFFVSEWDNPWPNEWRAESSLLLAAAGSLQGWGGFAIHTYRYSTDEDVDMIGKPITSDAIGGIYYRGGIFDTFNDPAKFGLFYHAALITRRGDVRPSGQTVRVQLDKLTDAPGVKALQLTPERQRVEMVLPGQSAGRKVVKADEPLVDAKAGEVLSDTGELYRNLSGKYGWIDSPRTKAVYGFVGAAGKIILTDLQVHVNTDFATVALSSLTDEPLSNTDNMLLTTVGRADNTGSKYNPDHTKQLAVGHGPIRVEVIEAAFALQTNRPHLRVMAINPQGMVIGFIPSEYKDGIFRFEVGKEFQSMYYLIQSL